MSTIPVLSGREVASILAEFGWEIARRPRGSHIIMVKSGNPATLSVPDHREVARGTLRTLIRRAGLTPEEFLSKVRAK